MYWPSPDTSPIENVYGPAKIERKHPCHDPKLTKSATVVLPTFDSDFAWLSIVELLHTYKLGERDMVAIF